MGIFDVKMKTSYGEGKAAFYRLQEQIMEKEECDTSIFAWGRGIISTADLPGVLQSRTDAFIWGLESEAPSLGLLSESPKSFIQAGSIIFDVIEII